MSMQTCLTIHQHGEILSERPYLGLETIVEHVSYHQHASARPLAHAAQVWMVELGLRTFTRYHRFK